MLLDNMRWRGGALIAIAYVYFLIFAHFCFLETPGGTLNCRAAFEKGNGSAGSWRSA